jgi:hypothetical protein
VLYLERKKKKVWDHFNSANELSMDVSRVNRQLGLCSASQSLPGSAHDVRLGKGTATCTRSYVHLQKRSQKPWAGVRLKSKVEAEPSWLQPESVHKAIVRIYDRTST